MNRTLNLFAVLVAPVVICASAVAQSTGTLPERFDAVAISTGGPRSDAVNTPVEITINRWSTPEENQRLINALKAHGPEAMLGTLRDLKSVGTINTPGNLAYDLRYAYQERTGEGGRQIVLATDRPISYWEAVNQPRIINYPFTFIELRMNSRGEGEGKLALATKIDVSSNGKLIELVGYSAQPIQLNEVRHRAD
jgi:hypothetical protein